MSVVANVAINVDSSNAVSKLRQVQTQAQATERAFGGISSAAGKLQTALASIGVGLALTKVIADVKELDTNIRRLGTVGVDVGKISPALSNLSKELGGVASKAELAAASYQAASAGFSDTAGNINILRAATKAAVGGLADTQAVTEVLVKTLNAYGMSGNQALQVTDSISKAVELGNQEWSDYTSQLGRVASIAALAGVSLDEVNAFIASATKNGATAEVAFTGLSSVLTQLLQPTKESQEAAAKLGVQFNLAGLQTKGLGGLMADLAVAINKDKEAAARMVGPTEAMRGAFAAASKNGTDFKNILNQIGDASGKTDMDFQTMKGSLENTFKALDTAFKNLSEAIGKAFGPTLVVVIRDITGAVNTFADVMNGIPQPVMNALGELTKFIATAILLQKTIQGIIALRVAYAAAMGSVATSTAAAGTAAVTSSSAFALYTANTRTLTGAAVAAVPPLTGLRAVLASLASIGAITIAVNVAVYGLQELLRVRAELDRLRGKKPGAIPKSGVFPGETKQGLIKRQELQRGQVPLLQSKIATQKAIAAGMPTGTGSLARAELAILEGRLAEATRTIAADPNKLRSATPKPATIPTVPTGSTTGGKTGKKAKTDDTAAKIAASAAELSTARQLYEIEGRLLEARQGSIQPLILARTAQKELATFSGEAAAIKADKELPAAIKKNKLDDLALKAAGVSRQLAFDINQYEGERSKNFDEIIAGLDFELKLKKATTEEARQQLQLEEDLRKLKGQGLTDEQLGSIAGKKKELNAPEASKTAAQTIEARIGKLKDEIKELTNIGNIAVKVADGIGVAFGQAFQGLIDGSMTAREALGSFFKSVGEMFVSMAVEIIAKQMTMIVLGLIMKALGLSTGGGVSDLNAPANINNPLGNLGNIGGAYAKGGTFSNGIAAFANGGIVGSPTLFKFADGGATRTGLMGEAGPEAIMPLKRDGSGRLGVNASGLRDAMAGGNSGGGGGTTLNMSFETTSIGGVEYVSRDQLEAAMAQTRKDATRDGAKKGMSMTIDRLQQSPQTRSRVGMR